MLPKSQKVEPSDCVFVLLDLGLILLYCVLIILTLNSMFVLCQCVVEVVTWLLDCRSLWVRVFLASHIRYVLESFNPSSYETLCGIFYLDSILLMSEYINCLYC